MKAKYNSLRNELEKFMEDTGGKGSWKQWKGSQMEADVISFVEQKMRGAFYHGMEAVNCDNCSAKGTGKKFEDILKQ